MASTCGRNTGEFTFVLSHRFCHHNYSLFMLCCLASLACSAPSIVAELLEERTAIAQGCSPAERDALLAFKSSILDPSNRLASWNSQRDCCSWSGVVCYNDTTTTRVYVVELNLANPNSFDEETILQGEKLSPSLLSLTHLESLNLSKNDFGGAQIPEFIGLFQNLRFLDLQRCNFGGTIPPQLGNLSSLRYLDLSIESTELRVQSLDWLTCLSSLTYLDMSLVNLSAVSHNWLSTMNMLPSLQALRLSACSLDQISSSLSHLNLTSLVTIDLSGNNFNSTLPNWLWQLTTLSSLDLSFNFLGTLPPGIGNLSSITKLSLFDTSLSGPLPNEIWSLTHLTELNLAENLLGGPIPVGIGNLTSLTQLFSYNCLLSGSIPAEIGNLISLTELDLNGNSLNGSIPIEIGNLTSLTTLYLDTNSLTGLIPIEIGKLYNLIDLDLASNSLKDVISQLHFTNLTNLHYLDLSNNSLLTIAIDHNWIPPFQLEFLVLNSVKLGPIFPMWLKSQNSIIGLSLSNTGIEGNLPSWFWTSFPTIKGIDLSYNKITGTLPISIENHNNLIILNLHSNLLEGPIPKLPFNLFVVDLSNNFLSGPLPSNFSSAYYVLSYNQIHGRIPLSICNSTQLEILDLSHNQIFGQIPHCEWLEPKYLRFIHLGNNNISGKIPSNIGQLNNIESLHINNNNLYGQIPSSLQNCKQLLLVDLSNNKLSGNIPTWLGESLQQLNILLLRSNMFSGDIPLQIGQLSKLRIIDFANNLLIGSIPYSLGNLSAVISTSITVSYDISFEKIIEGVSFKDTDSITTVMKGYEYSFSNTLFLVRSIDLSNNGLIGEIPKELGFLEGLQTLNLSRNHLKGNIPKMIGGMKSLETLDLSYNMLSGEIPQDLSALNSLNHLNLSYNNLSGMIPQGYQLQTLQDASLDKGNANLCGAPINKSCSDHKNNTIIEEDHEDSSQMLQEYLGVTLGFLLGLWSVYVILLFKKGWRNLYFLMIDKYMIKLYVSIKIRQNK